MTAQTPGSEDPIKYTKESLAGLRDVWWSFGKARYAQYAAAIEQYAAKLPTALKKKTTPPASTSDSTTAANAPS
jgi:hypothetical protein